MRGPVLCTHKKQSDFKEMYVSPRPAMTRQVPAVRSRLMPNSATRPIRPEIRKL